MPFLDIEQKRKVAREYYHRVRRTPEHLAKAAEQSRVRRANMTPEQTEECRRKAREWARANPVPPEVQAEKNAAKYKEAKKDPAKWARIQAGARQRYWANQPWRIVTSLRRRAKLKGFVFDLTKEWVYARWTAHCELTGLPFLLGSTKLSPFSPSVDRIDNSKGYEQSNCRFILFGLNAAKNSGTDADLLQIARALVRASDAR